MITRRINEVLDMRLFGKTSTTGTYRETLLMIKKNLANSPSYPQPLKSIREM